MQLTDPDDRVIAEFRGSNDRSPPSDVDSLAMTNPAIEAAPDLAPIQDSVVTDPLPDPSRTAEVQIASANLDRQPVSSGETDNQADLSRMTADRVAMNMPDPNSSSDSMVDFAANSMPAEGDSGPAKSVMGGAILVVQVNVKPGQDRSQVVSGAMQLAGVSIESQAALSDSLMDSATEASNVPGNSSFEIFYLSSTARRLDRLYLELAGDTQRVSSVGLSLAMDAPIMGQVRQFASDPTEVRNEIRAVPIDNSDADFLTSVQKLSYVPVSPQMVPDVNDGVDEPAQIILIVR